MSRLLLVGVALSALACVEPDAGLVVSVEPAAPATLLFGRPVTHVVRLRNATTRDVYLSRCDAAVPSYLEEHTGNRWMPAGEYATGCLAIYSSVQLQLAPGAEYLSPLPVDTGRQVRRVRVPFGGASDRTYDRWALSPPF